MSQSQVLLALVAACAWRGSGVDRRCGLISCVCLRCTVCVLFWWFWFWFCLGPGHLCRTGGSRRGRLVWRRVRRNGDGAFLSLFFPLFFSVFHVVFIGFRLWYLFSFRRGASGSAAFRFGCKSLVSK